MFNGEVYRFIHDIPDIDVPDSFKGATVSFLMFGRACRQGCVTGNILSVGHTDFSNDDFSLAEQSF